MGAQDIIVLAEAFLIIGAVFFFIYCIIVELL